jgi:hypothetical protein
LFVFFPPPLPPLFLSFLILSISLLLPSHFFAFLYFTSRFDLLRFCW